MSRLFIVAVFATALVPPGQAAPMSAPGTATIFGLQPTDPTLHGGNPLNRNWSRYSPAAKKLRDLHDEGVKIRDADGGKLSEEHRAYLQGKLDAILAEARQER